MDRKTKAIAILGILLLAAATLGAVQWVARQTYFTQGWEQGIPEPVADTALIGDASLNAPCANTALENYDADQLDQVLGWVTDGGFGWIRQKFSWAEIEPQPGRFDWSVWDVRVASLAEQRIGIWAVLDEAPSWAGAPPDAHAFARFAGAFAERYGEDINYYQIWHNINIGNAWGGYANAYSYTELLALSAQVVRAVDPDARIVLGSMAPNTETGEKNFAEDVFLDMLYAAGAGPYFDVVSVQPYGFHTSPMDRRVKPSVMNFSRPELVRQVIISHGEAGKAIWGSNFGWNALSDSTRDVTSIWGSVDEVTQATYMSAAYDRAAREWPWMGLLCANILQPRFAGRQAQVPDAEEHWGFALINPDGTPRMVYDRIRAWAADNTGASNGTYPADTPYADYTGSWTLGPQGADIGQSGDRADFAFTGTGLALTVRKGPYRAFLYVTIDEQPAPALPVDRDGQAYIVLYDPLAAVATVPLAEGLPFGKHRATIIADRGWGQWALVDWRVSHAPDKHGYYAGLSAYSGLALLGAYLILTSKSWNRLPKLWSSAYALWQRSRALVKSMFSVVSSAVYLFAAWHLLIGDGLFRRLGEHGDWVALLLSTGLFYFSHWFILTLIAGTVVTLLILLRPSLGLALSLFAAPLYLHPLSLFGKSFALSELVLLPTLVGVALSVLREGSWRPLWKSLWHTKMRWLPVSIFLFVGFGLLSSLVADFRHEALREWRLVVLEPALFFFALLLLKMSDRQRSRILDALIASAVMVALVGLVQYFWLGDVITAEGGIARLRSIYGSPNNVGLYLGRVLPILIALAFGPIFSAPTSPTHLTGEEPRRWQCFLNQLHYDQRLLSKRRVLYAFAIVPVALALFLSLSRGAILLGIPAALLTLGLFAGKSWRRITIVLLILGGLALVPILQLPRFVGLLDWSGGTTGFRISLWYSTLQMIRESPLLGVGLDNFLYAYRTRYVLPTAWEEFNLSHPHNVFLDFASRLGLPGLCLFMWTQFAFWRTLVPNLKSQRPEIRAITLGMMASMANFLAHGLVDASYFIIDLAYVYMLSCAVALWIPSWNIEQEGDDEITIAG